LTYLISKRRNDNAPKGFPKGASVCEVNASNRGKRKFRSADRTITAHRIRCYPSASYTRPGYEKQTGLAAGLPRKARRRYFRCGALYRCERLSEPVGRSVGTKATQANDSRLGDAGLRPVGGGLTSERMYVQGTWAIADRTLLPQSPTRRAG
jgi:hypothetical protein